MSFLCYIFLCLLGIISTTTVTLELFLFIHFSLIQRFLHFIRVFLRYLWESFHFCSLKYKSKDIFNPFSVSIPLYWFACSFIRISITWKRGYIKHRRSIELNLLFHGDKFFIKLFFFLFLLNKDKLYFFHWVLFRKSVKMFFLIPVKIIDSWNLLF